MQFHAMHQSRLTLTEEQVASACPSVRSVGHALAGGLTAYNVQHLSTRVYGELYKALKTGHATGRDWQ